MTANMDDNGVRYGVISGKSLDSDVIADLMDNGINLTCKAACEEARAEFVGKWEYAAEDADIAAAETDYHMVEKDKEEFVLKHIQTALKTTAEDAEEYVEKEMETWGEYWECDECTYEGTKDGVNYRLSWLGGAPLVWALGGLVGYAKRLCSPCVPNAADLDGGYEVGEFNRRLNPSIQPGLYFDCYVVPKGWLWEES